MAKRTANTNTQTAAQTAATAPTQNTTFSISGILDSVYVGKKYAYATVKVNKDNGYYDQYKVQCDLDYDFPDDGQPITLVGRMSRYKNDISFIDKSCDEVSNN